MKANELRIGNYVTDEFYSQFKTVIEVNDLNDKGINLIIDDDVILPTPKYIHQLQNLYYALTGEELQCQS